MCPSAAFSCRMSEQHSSGGEVFSSAIRLILYYSPECWPSEMLKPVAVFSPGSFPVVSTKMLALLSSPWVSGTPRSSPSARERLRALPAFHGAGRHADGEVGLGPVLAGAPGKTIRNLLDDPLERRHAFDHHQPLLNVASRTQDAAIPVRYLAEGQAGEVLAAVIDQQMEM